MTEKLTIKDIKKIIKLIMGSNLFVFLKRWESKVYYSLKKY